MYAVFSNFKNAHSHFFRIHQLLQLYRGTIFSRFSRNSEASTISKKSEKYFFGTRHIVTFSMASKLQPFKTCAKHCVSLANECLYE